MMMTSRYIRRRKDRQSLRDSMCAKNCAGKRAFLPYIVPFLTLLSISCSETPTRPSPTPVTPPAQAQPEPPPPAQVATILGQWTGTLTFTFRGNRGFLTTPVELQQADRAVTGTWTVTTPGNDIRGEIGGTLTGEGAQTRFSGTVTWNSETVSGTGRCRGVATFTGAAFPPVLEWTSPGWDFGTTCTDAPTDAVWRFVRN